MSTIDESFDEELFKKVVNVLMGEEAVIIALNVLNHPETTDEDIALETELNIKVIRNILFKLNEESLAFFRRERNPDTGYFIYHWTIDVQKLKRMLENKLKLINQLISDRINYEEENLLYTCGNDKCTPLSLDEAYEYGFVCPACNEALDEQTGEEKKAVLLKTQEKLKKF